MLIVVLLLGLVAALSSNEIGTVTLGQNDTKSMHHKHHTTTTAAPPSPSPTSLPPPRRVDIHRIQVGIVGIPPFVLQREEAEQAAGLMVDVWREIERESNWASIFVPFPSVRSLIEALDVGQIDVGFGGVTLTSEREKHVIFSLPVHQSGLAILTRAQQRGTLSAIFDAVFSHQIWTAACMVLWSLAIAGHVAWYLEARANPAFRGDDGSYLSGVLRSTMWAAVTVTTVGYGDQVPATRAGRAFAVTWMFFGLITVGFLSGSISSHLTVAQLQTTLQGPQDLPGHQVATVANSTSEAYLERNGIGVTTVEVISDAFALLASKEVDAVVYDGPMLLYYAVRHGRRHGFRLVGNTFEEQSYGIAVRRGAGELVDNIDVTLLRMREDYRYQALSEKWLGKSEDSYADAQFHQLDSHTTAWVLYAVTSLALTTIGCLYWTGRARILDRVFRPRSVPAEIRQALARLRGVSTASKAADQEGVRDRAVGEWDHDDEDLVVDEHLQGGPAAPMTRSEAAVMRAHLAALDKKMDMILERLTSGQGNAVQ